MNRVFTLARDGCDRSTAYHMSNKIAREGDGLWVTWLDEAYRCVLARVSAGGRVLSRAFLAQGFDNHCGGALARTPDGALHFVSGSHHVAFVYRHSQGPEVGASWSPPEAVGVGGTYPSLVADPAGGLHLAHRQMGEREEGTWGVAAHEHRPPGPWKRWGVRLLDMPAPLYSFPTNSLAAGPDGALHLLVEWYKTWPGKGAPARSLGVSHFLRAPSGEWRFDDGRPLEKLPSGMGESPLAVSRPGGNPRPGNLALLRDGRPFFGYWDQADGALVLAVKGAGGGWRLIDLTSAAERLDPGRRFNSQPQAAVNAAGEIVLVACRAEGGAWADPSSRLHAYWIDPSGGEVLRHLALEKRDPREPDWLPSIEKPGPGVFPEAPWLLYQTGRRGEGCVNAARCAVNLSLLQ